VQEEVEQKTVNLAVQTAKVTSRELYRALKRYHDDHKAKVTAKTKTKDETTHGKQSVKELVGQGQGVSSMDIGDSGVRDFQKIANKYGVDFAIVKDKTADPPKYTVFFKAKDADAITNVLKEYSAKQLKKQQRKSKPSILTKLKKFKEIVANTPRKEKEKRKDRER